VVKHSLPVGREGRAEEGGISRTLRDWSGVFCWETRRLGPERGTEKRCVKKAERKGERLAKWWERRRNFGGYLACNISVALGYQY